MAVPAARDISFEKPLDKRESNDMKVRGSKVKTRRKRTEERGVEGLLRGKVEMPWVKLAAQETASFIKDSIH